jgi:hypothetical protein
MRQPFHCFLRLAENVPRRAGCAPRLQKPNSSRIRNLTRARQKLRGRKRPGIISTRASRYIRATGVAIPELALARSSRYIADYSARDAADRSADRRTANVISDRATNDGTSRRTNARTLLGGRAACQSQAGQ